MIIPVRCFTCGKVIGDKYEYFVRERKKKEKESESNGENGKKEDSLAFYDSNYGQILNDLGLHKLCCRRHMLGHVELIEMI